MRCPVPSAAVLLLSLLAGCAAAPQITVRQRATSPVAARAIAVYPFASRWDEPAWRGYLKAMDAVQLLVDRGRLLVFAPGEFLLFRADVDDPRIGTDLVSVLAHRNLPPSAFLALRGWAERRVERTTGELDGHGVVRSSEEVTTLVHLDLLDGRSGRPILELEGRARRDPGAPADPFDPSPEVTRLQRALLDALWSELAPLLTAPPPPRVGVMARWLPASALTWAPPGRPSLLESLASKDALDADLARLAVYRYVDPTSDDAVVSRAMRRPGGLLVEKAEPPWSDGLRPGDVIVQAAGEAVVGPQVLQRAAAPSRAGAIDLVVDRGGVRVPVTVVLP
jgi:hypothetical protein